jgi:uncharacterized membrane protein
MSIARRVFLQVRYRPRLAIAVVAGVLSLLFLPDHLPRTTRGLIAWDLGVGLYLVLALIMVLRSNVERVRWRASIEDDGALVALLLTVAAAVASVAAIFIELINASDLPRHDQTLRLALVITTIVLSWAYVHIAFALHYAHEFYDQDAKAHAKLRFPGTEEPDYVDFLYFAFVIGMTSQTSDVAISSSALRRLVLIHGVIAFFFNTTLLAITINIAAGLV